MNFDQSLCPSLYRLHSLYAFGGVSVSVLRNASVGNRQISYHNFNNKRPQLRLKINIYGVRTKERQRDVKKAKEREYAETAIRRHQDEAVKEREHESERGVGVKGG